MKRKKKQPKPLIIKTNILKVRNLLHLDAQIRFPARISKSKKQYDRKKAKRDLIKIKESI